MSGGRNLRRGDVARKNEEEIAVWTDSLCSSFREALQLELDDEARAR